MTALRHHTTLARALALAVTLAIPGTAHRLRAQDPATDRVILVTLDGVRPEDFFGGMDSVVAASESLSGIADTARLRAAYWRPTAVERRRALMPFLWDSLAPRGVVLGDPSLGERVTITNGHAFSAPGYLEILTGQPQPDVKSNDRVRYDHETVLEYLRRRLKLAPTGVALFGSWENFREYGASRDGAVFINAGFDSLPAGVNSPEMRRLAVLETRARPVWDGARLDVFTGALALAYLRRYQPTVLYVAMDDTDDLAHIRRYDRVLDALHALDAFLWELWNTAESLPGYRGHTTLIVTTDHGRGLTPTAWSDHGADVKGAGNIWLAVIGPHTPHRGAIATPAGVHQANIAGTLLACLGLSVTEWNRGAGAAIPGVCAPGR